MNAVRTLFIAGILVLAAACHSDNTPAPIAPAQQKDGGVIPQAQLKALNDAKALDSTLQENEKKRLEQIDQQ